MQTLNFFKVFLQLTSAIMFIVFLVVVISTVFLSASFYDVIWYVITFLVVAWLRMFMLYFQAALELQLVVIGLAKIIGQGALEQLLNQIEEQMKHE